MTRYLISFDDGAMTFPEEELADVAAAAQEVRESSASTTNAAEGEDADCGRQAERGDACRSGVLPS